MSTWLLETCRVSK